MKRTPPPAMALRTVLLLSGCVLLCWGTWSLVRAPMLAAGAPLLAHRGGLGQVRLETALVGACAAVLLACVLWVVALTVLSVAGLLARELAPGSHRTARLAREVERRCPAPVRRLAAMVLGVTLGAGVALPAMATVDPPPTPVQLSGQLAGLSLPDRATGAGLVTAPRPTIARRGSPGPVVHRDQVPGYVVVRPGDSLWQIAQTLLPAAATGAEITRAWHLIDHVNSERIGADPDLIRPGTRLALPPIVPSHRKDSS